MHLACRYPDRVKGLISIDSAPVDESAQWEEFNKDVKAILEFMNGIEPEVIREEVIKRAEQAFPGRTYIH